MICSQNLNECSLARARTSSCGSESKGHKRNNYIEQPYRTLLYRHKCFTRKLVCKTVRIFAYSNAREQSNKRSGTKLRLARDSYATLYRFLYWSAAGYRSISFWEKNRLFCSLLENYPGFQRIFFLIDNEAALKQKKAARRKKFLLGALRLVNAASPRTISVHKKKISSGTQGTGKYTTRKNYIRDSSGFHMWVYRWRNFGHFPLLFYRCLFV